MKRFLCILAAAVIGLFGVCLSAHRVARAEAQETGQEVTEKNAYGCTGMAVRSSGLWQVMNGQIRCLDAQSLEVLAMLPLETVLQAGNVSLEQLTFMEITAGEEDSVWLVTADGEKETRVTLFELGLAGSEVTVRSVMDGTEALAFIGQGKVQRSEIMFSSCSRGFLIVTNAGQQDFEILTYRSGDAQTETWAALDSLVYLSVLAYGEDLLIVRDSEQMDGTITFSRMSFATGEEKVLKEISVENAESPINFACDPENGMVYFTINSTAYRMALEGEGEPEPFAVLKELPSLLRTGVYTQGHYLQYSDEGEILSSDTHTTLQAVPLKVANLRGDETVIEAAASFNAGHPEYLVTVASVENEGRVLDAMLNQSTDFDAYVIGMNTSLYRTLRERGYLTDLSSGSLLTEAAADMSPKVQEEIHHEGRLVAFPIGVESGCLLFNTEALAALTGIPAEELPTDWAGFLDMLSLLAEKGSLENNSQYILYEDGISADIFRTTLLFWILEDCFTWLDQEGNRVDDLTTVLLPVLKALEKVDFVRLGLSEEENLSRDWLEEEKIPLIISGMPEIAVTFQEYPGEYWPLSMEPGGERLIGQVFSVMIVNPHSPNRDGAIRFIEAVWSDLNILTRMMLCRNLNEPIPNTSYNEEMAFFEQLIPMYEEGIAAAEDENEAETLREELDEIRAYISQYQTSALWIASENSIAAYRNLEQTMVPAAPDFWKPDDENAPILQYMDGLISSEQFVTQLINAMKMSQMEGV